MNDIVRRTALGMLLLAALARADARAQSHEGLDLAEISGAGEAPESIIISWPNLSYRLARKMLAQYGQPVEAGDHRLVWLENGPWRKTVVYRNPPGESVLGPNAGRLEQSVAYRVPEDKLKILARFDREIGVEMGDETIMVLSNSESGNFLALNLADEVIKGKRTPRAAAAFRRKLLRLRNAGKSSPYLERLLFARGGALASPD